MVDVGTQCSDGSSGNPQETRPIFVHGCFEHRLGCALELIDSLRYLVNNRESTSHQCAGVRGRTSISAPLAGVAHRSNSACYDGQLHGSNLHQQAGQDTVTITVQMDKEKCQNNKVVLRARHIPGRINVLADVLFLSTQVSGTEWSLHPSVFQAVIREWSLHPSVFQSVIREWGIPFLDLFATRWNHKLPISICMAVDALPINWKAM